MRLCRASLALAVLAVGAAYALDPPPLDDAEIDDRANVWAISHAKYNEIFVFDGKQWAGVPVPFPDGAKAMAAGLARFHDGSVACVWRLSSALMAVSRHSGGESRILWQGAGEAPPGGLDVEPFCDSQNRLWMTDSGPQIQWVDGKGGSRLVCDLANVEMLRVHLHSNPVPAAEDGLGRIWIWTNSLAGQKEYSTIAGVLISDGEKVEQKVLFGSEEKRFGPIVRKGSRHMWVSVMGEGLFELDIRTLASRRLGDPAENEFKYVERLFVSGKDAYVITSRGKLWRWRKNRWTSLINEVDGRPDKNRKWLSDGNSLFLGAETTAWFLGNTPKAIPLDWRNRFPLEGVKNFLRLPDGRFFVLGQRGKYFCGEINPIRPPSRAEQLDVRFGCSLDASGRIWCVEGRDKNTLKKWNGNGWSRHPFPGGFAEEQFRNLLADEQGRVWLFPDAAEGPVIFFDSAAEKWRTFANPEEAFESLISSPPKFVEPSRWSWSDGTYRPIYSGNRIAFRSPNGIKYFDGEFWRSWNAREVQPFSHERQTDTPPFFDATGHLCVNTTSQTWQWDDKRWATTGELDPASRDAGPPKPAPLEPPEGVASNVGAIVRDNRGGYWFLSKNALFKAVPGARVRIFRADEPTPFLSEHRLQEVVVDSGGSTFLQTAGSAWILLRSLSSPPPRVQVTATAENDDACLARFDSSSLSDLTIRWQLDESPWQQASGKKILLEDLPNGRHVLRAQALSADLLFSPTATAEFEIRIDSEKQLAALIARLGDPDFAKRETAVTALLRQPEAALPALRAAHDGAPASQRWWIDATIQQIGNRSK